MSSLTNDTLSTASVTNDALMAQSSLLTWAEANFTWGEAQGTWEQPYGIANDSITTGSITNDTIDI